MARRRSFSIAALLSLGLCSAGHAADREYVVRWHPPAGAAPEGYRIHVSSEDRRPVLDLDVGPVAPGSDGVGRYAILLPAESGSYVRMTAYNQGGESQPSNEIFVAATLCDPAFCDDADPCTADTCSIAGCVHSPLADGTECGDSGAVCNRGECTDADCRADSDCADAGACFEAARCESFVCVSGPAVSCGEPSQCAIPICDAAEGCQMLPLADGTTCDDGDAATRRDQCRAGTCRGALKTSGSGGGGKGRGR